MLSEIGPSTGKNWTLAAANRRPMIPERYRLDFDLGPRPAVQSRRYDPAIGCWVLDPPAEIPLDLGPRADTARPRGDGSGVFWEVFDRLTGVRLWIFDAISFHAALLEKRVLCQIARYKGGDAYLRPVRQ